ncbi:thioredoxin domain-containing protein [Paracoccus stylophorae]|uniref:Thioredoxin domain-containing protein n=1 Tax=Paracoccus stylophorae TaxID=659350 RepID=A0ABY7SSG1_9RHOB|nr:thioredoxin domain-containing protein [Paracoccus stylophorae]WCR09834.1 thioredoxin domain-containing protein [Paracoccus stylophorae]
MNRRTLVISTAAAAVAAFGGGAVLVQRGRAANSAQLPANTPSVDQSRLTPRHAPVLGPTDAPVTLVEFFDPSCEACRAFHPVLQRLRDSYPTQLRLVLRYTVFHEGSDEAVRILETARMQDRFEPILDALLDQQPRWAIHDSPQMDRAWQIAAEAGLDLERAQGDRLFPGITGVLNQDATDVEALEIRATPTFFLNGRRLENVSQRSLEDAVSQAVAAV